MNNKDYILKVSLAAALLLFSQGCSQKQGFIPQIQEDTGISRVFDFSEDITRGQIVGNATLMASDRYLFATGTGSGFGIFNFSGSFISGTSAISVDARTPNFIDGDVRNVLSMVTAQNNLYISSRAGLYQINLSQIQNPQTSLALPYGAPNLFGTFGGYTSSIPQFSEASKEQFRWDSMVYVSQLNQIWGFRGNRMSRLNLGGLSYDPRPQVATNFQLDTSCDPAFKRSSAVFQGKVYVAACSRVLVLNPNSTGNITSESFRYQLNAVQVVATQNRLYVHHEPSYSWGRYSSSTPEGIYVFDAGLNYINYVPIQPISFAVSPDDQYLFANEDNYDVGVYAISQGGRLGTLAR